MKRNSQNDNFWQSARNNKSSYIQYFDHLTELSLAMFDWKNLPDTVDPRFLELALFYDGQAVFFKDDVMGYLGLRCLIGGKLNVYQIPVRRTAYAASGYRSQPLDESNSVIIYNNYLHQNSMLDVQLFAKRLANIDRTIDTNINAQKTPVIVRCDENQRLTLRNLVKNYEGNEPFIWTDKKMNLGDNIQVLNTGAPLVAPALYQLKTELWNEALSYLGIMNVSEKKERMIVDEVSRNQGGIVASRYTRLAARQEACNKINRMFGLDIWCEYKPDYDESLLQLPTEEETNNE